MSDSGEGPACAISVCGQEKLQVTLTESSCGSSPRTKKNLSTISAERTNREDVKITGTVIVREPYIFMLTTVHPLSKLASRYLTWTDYNRTSLEAVEARVIRLGPLESGRTTLVLNFYLTTGEAHIKACPVQLDTDQDRPPSCAAFTSWPYCWPTPRHRCGIRSPPPSNSLM